MYHHENYCAQQVLVKLLDASRRATLLRNVKSVDKHDYPSRRFDDE